MKLALLNTSIITAPGVYSYTPDSLDTVKQLVAEADEVVSYIGHEGAAKVLSDLLGIDVVVNRAMYRQEVGDIAIVFKLNQRVAEPRELTRDEVEEIGYELGVLVRSSAGGMHFFLVTAPTREVARVFAEPDLGIAEC